MEEKMKTEELKDLGLNEEQIKSIFAMNGKEIEEFKSQIKEAKKALEDANLEKGNATKLVEEMQEKLKGFDGVDIDGMKNTIADLQSKMDAQAKDFENQKLERAFQEKLDSFITNKHGKNTKAIKSLLDVASLRDSKNQDADIESAIDAIAKDNDYLFGSDEPIKKPVLGTGGSGGADPDIENIAMARKVMGLPPLKND